MIDTPDKARWAQRQRILLAILLLLLVVLLVKAVLVGRHAYVLWQHGMRLRGLMADPAAVFDPQEPALISLRSKRLCEVCVPSSAGCCGQLGFLGIGRV